MDPGDVVPLITSVSFSGYEVLTEIQNILGEDENKPRQEGMLVDASNRFFTLIPTVHPVVISDSETLKSKVLIFDLSFYLNIRVICKVSVSNSRRVA